MPCKVFPPRSTRCSTSIHIISTSNFGVTVDNIILHAAATPAAVSSAPGTSASISTLAASVQDVTLHAAAAPAATSPTPGTSPSSIIGTGNFPTVSTMAASEQAVTPQVATTPAAVSSSPEASPSVSTSAAPEPEMGAAAQPDAPARGRTASPPLFLLLGDTIDCCVRDCPNDRDSMAGIRLPCQHWTCNDCIFLRLAWGIQHGERMYCDSCKLWEYPIAYRSPEDEIVQSADYVPAYVTTGPKRGLLSDAIVRDYHRRMMGETKESWAPYSGPMMQLDPSVGEFISQWYKESCPPDHPPAKKGDAGNSGSSS
ncbi:hypothetical protein B0H63DRAFT_527125 [Podospora didyma]|uniref:Uncharacterized protein n=1 Tax=Podospora didyma TaxID=330526 RepID=A0AAE0K8S0_9PEZI|nr:hypothetical protein B0H63DRAFT_527125 [Podospora didyma]